MEIKEHFSLEDYNTFGIAAKTRYFVEISSVTGLRQVVKARHYQSLSKLILGGGSNILLTKDFDGLVIFNAIKGIEIVQNDYKSILVKIGAGENWHDFVMWCVKERYYGVENLSLIPGTVGAAPIQNIGAYGVELRDVFHSLKAMDMETGQVLTYDKKACEFGYRDSIFKRDLKGKVCITSVTLRLNKTTSFQIAYAPLKKRLEDLEIKKLSLRAVSDAVIFIRESKLPNPKVLGNSGSFFKNPIIETTQFNKLKKQYPNIVGYPQGETQTKVAAGWLIEHAGWKGKKVGNTGSHAQQALVLVNYGGATGDEVLKLSADIQASVKEKYGIDLEREVNAI